jgi:hypothetical protein
MASKMGWARENTDSSPPAMMASDALRAPSTPPLTGQSRKPTPKVSRWACMSRAVPALTVEQSITIMFGLKPESSPLTTARTSSSADTQITTASQLPANSARLLKA